MSSYTLNKMIRDVNRDPVRREAFFKDAAAFASAYQPLTEEERRAFVELDVGALYRLGVHGLILRPFTVLHKLPEPEYLAAIRN